jgi:hypothetical protein
MLSILTAGVQLFVIASRTRGSSNINRLSMTGTFIINATVFPIVATAVSSLPMPLSFRSVSSVTDGRPIPLTRHDCFPLNLSGIAKPKHRPVSL